MTGTDVLDAETAAHFRARLALYRSLVAAIKRLCLAVIEIERRAHQTLASNTEMFFERRETQVN